MITEQETIFILISATISLYRFPTAYELTKFICKNYANLIRILRSDIFLEQLRLHQFISKSSEISIYNFLTRYEDEEKFKHIINHLKMTIFLSISHYEKLSNLNKHFLDIKDDWYV